MVSASLASQAQIDGLWAQIGDDIVKCIEKTPTYFTAAELWTMCRAGSAFLIIAHEGTTVFGSSIWRFEDDNFVCLMLTGKRADEWIAATYERAAVTARMGGAKQLMASGRVGLFRKLRKHLPMVKMIRCTVAVEV
jgi:hypothetical protein